ncbi:helix-turn-helix domain-containing protein [Streptomyces sp. NPDC057654]|uniref:helix-turn-helix domain-containing protein n=1 Tax=Streptomyces sp. NPDC057654 TaxID=3346196 RepID=UPI0036D076E8
MVRTPLTELERERGRHLGVLLRQARGERSMAEIAALAGISAETLRKIETGRAPTPAFFTITALAGALGLRLDELAVECALRLAADAPPEARESPEPADVRGLAGAVGGPVAA